MKVAIELFHGREHTAQHLDDWGTQGPVFLVDYIHVTYLSDIKLGIPEPNGDGDLRFVDDLVYYDGIYYGDWSVFSPDILDAEQKARITEFDHSKAHPPEACDCCRHWRGGSGCSCEGGQCRRCPDCEPDERKSCPL